MNAQPMAKENFKFVISRTFDAPRALVWKAWTEKEQLQKWFSPKGFQILDCEMDFKVGGIYHYGLKSPDGTKFWGKWIFREISAPQKLVFINAFSDASGKNITRHPWNANWPLEMLSTITFIERGSETEVTVQWEPHNATAIERKTFEDNAPSMEQGWGGTLEQLTHYLAAERL